MKIHILIIRPRDGYENGEPIRVLAAKTLDGLRDRFRLYIKERSEDEWCSWDFDLKEIVEEYLPNIETETHIDLYNAYETYYKTTDL